MDLRTKLIHLVRPFVVLVVVVACSSINATANSQADLRDTKIELSIKEGKIIEIMNEISSNTEYFFIYEDGIKGDLKKKITIEHGENLHDLLTEISKKSNLEFGLTSAIHGSQNSPSAVSFGHNDGPKVFA